MTNVKTVAKQSPNSIMDSTILIVCLCVTAFRGMYSESPHSSITNINLLLSSQTFSLILSSTLILSAIIWFVSALCQGWITFKLNVLSVAAACFFIAGIASILAASNKRVAINDLAALIAPMLMALVLIQLLDTPKKIRFALAVLLAMGVVSCFQSSIQSATNDETIRMYQENPAPHYEVAGMSNPNDFQKWQYEHRLYSKDVHSFMTTSNSAGSFTMLIGFAAIGLLAEVITSKQNTIKNLLYTFAVTAIVLYGLAITQSKGAIAAAALAAILLAVYLLFKNFINKHWPTIILCTIFATVAIGSTVIWYGSTHGTLPGGTSMLVRWQYWDAAAKMFADNPITGVGGGNFGSNYLQYKIPAASEAVADPHNFILSLLTQYGPLGLVAFCTAIAAALAKSLSTKIELIAIDTPAKTNKLFLAAIAAILCTMLFLRPIFIAENIGQTGGEKLIGIIILYIVPALVFAIGLYLARTGIQTDETADRNLALTTRACLVFGVLGVLVHNLIDFALFEPAVHTALWLAIACIAASNKTDRKQKTAPAIPIKIATITAGIFTVGMYCYFVLAPPIKTSSITQKVWRNINNAPLLDKAITADQLDPTALEMQGKIFMSQYEKIKRTNSQMPAMAIRVFSKAVNRDPADYKNYERLANACLDITEHATGQLKTDWFKQAYEWAERATDHYPGSGKLWLKLAEIAEQLKKDPTEYYQRAVEIEDEYQAQFKIMYPGQNIVSRIGEEKYQKAIRKSSKSNK